MGFDVVFSVVQYVTLALTTCDTTLKEAAWVNMVWFTKAFLREPWKETFSHIAVNVRYGSVGRCLFILRIWHVAELFSELHVLFFSTVY